MDKPPYDQRIARLLVRPLAATPITPNHITALTLALALGGAWLLAQGDARGADWGAGLFVLALGAAGAASAIISLFINLDIDKRMELTNGAATGYPGFAGFELEDGIYLIAPITWLGGLTPFFVLCGIGATVYCLWSVWSLVKLRNN